jgi:hypothetical protein
MKQTDGFTKVFLSGLEDATCHLPVLHQKVATLSPGIKVHKGKET